MRYESPVLILITALLKVLTIALLFILLILKGIQKPILSKSRFIQATIMELKLRTLRYSLIFK